MKVVFLSNYFNHHQKPLSDELYRLLGDEYKFIQTSAISQERLALGYRVMTEKYVLLYNDDKEQCETLINQADIVIFGSAPYVLIENRIKQSKIVLRCSERPLKKGLEPLKYIPRFIKWRKQFPPKKPVYLLAASAYATGDYAKFGMFKNKAFKWGYFTEVKEYPQIDELIEKKKKNSILWVSRFIPLKHPEIIIALAKRLVHDGYDFEINMIGQGELFDGVTAQIESLGLGNCVKLLGVMSPEQVRKRMEESEIFVFTSDRNEGWGAVMNESMNSACAVVASNAIGAVPFLVKNGENGFSYKDGDFEDFYTKVKACLDDKKLSAKLGKNAYLTMLNEWSPKVAAERLLNLCKELVGASQVTEYKNGPCGRS